MRLIDAEALIPVTLTDRGYWTKEIYYKTDVDAAPTITRLPNDPLTLKELRGMDGEPAWCKEENCWGIVAVNRRGDWAGIPFFEFRYKQANCSCNIEERELTIYPWERPEAER